MARFLQRYCDVANVTHTERREAVERKTTCYEHHNGHLRRRLHQLLHNGANLVYVTNTMSMASARICTSTVCALVAPCLLSIVWFLADAETLFTSTGKKTIYMQKYNQIFKHIQNPKCLASQLGNQIWRPVSEKNRGLNGRNGDVVRHRGVSKRVLPIRGILGSSGSLGVSFLVVLFLRFVLGWGGWGPGIEGRPARERDSGAKNCED